ncbi:crossover junction endodeoxyribonuclease RuvC [Anaeromyxobacter oryzisoli]|uniref:crossover junction endodeoxyribonuclease RuvC n=1 Tax=Anaeromyxobacter oryzisoli TaxID=2925408 RepID=UPI001F58F3C3|nr:crossover junction endodeoxyribonuclease RuvC [Anaeromyxobacter sp. SG63]
MIILGIDSGFSSLGLAAIELQPDREQLRDVWVVRTEKSARKLGVRSGDDTARRARELAHHVELAIVSHQAAAIALEAPSWPRNAGVAAKMGVAFGVVFALAEKHRLPLVMAGPMDVKLAVCRSKTATKDDVIAAVERRFPDITWPSQKTLYEHAADAVGVVLACLGSDVLQMARRLSA